MNKNLLRIYNKKFNNTLSEKKNKTLALSIWRQRRFLSSHLLLKSLYIRFAPEAEICKDRVRGGKKKTTTTKKKTRQTERHKYTSRQTDIYRQIDTQPGRDRRTDWSI